MWTIAGVIFLSVLYLTYDVNYFVRTFLAIAAGRAFQRDYSLDETTSYYGICTTQDVGLSLRMLPHRILRELDFARFHFWDRTGVYRRSQRMGFGALQAATHLQVVLPVKLLTVFRIDTKLEYWDRQSFLMRHRLVDVLSGRTYALMTSRQHVTGCADTQVALGCSAVSPQCPAEIQSWMTSVEVMSSKFRKS